ncbi:transglycosylase domain-containing protein [Kroppenstedtia eburnea]|uniref:transglycosylase domain-containing protein n=1 Tax=Kroppenstedtia eburnea TaxID=714067 RepID=UPI0036356D3E
MDNYQTMSGGIPPRSRSTGRKAKRRSLTGRSSRGGRGGGNGKRFRFFNKKWFLLVFITTILLAVGGCSAVMMSAKTYNMDEVKKSMESSSTVYDRNGKKVMQLGSTNREYVELKDVKSPELYQAFVAVEDERFYSHHGVDYWSLGRAVVKNIIALGKAEGGGTITMQVARNAVIKDRKKTYSRKLDEMMAALSLEKEVKKSKILETYLNYIDFGNNVQGIKMAAKIYFDKDITKEKLEPHEIALLAGLPKAPYGYDPFRFPEKAKFRRNVVLNKMAEETEAPFGALITQEEAEKYKKMDLGVKQEAIQKHLKTSEFYAYKSLILNEIEERYPGIDSKELINGGYKIYTALDPKVQKATEEALEKDEYFIDKDSGRKLKPEELNAAMTVLDAKSGEIVAVGGGRDYKPGFYNWSITNRQPGSAIKPISVYGPAIKDHNFNEYTMVKDEPIKIGDWEPKNMSRKVYGDIPMQEMVNNSLNLSTIRILRDQVKLPAAAEYAEKAGIHLDEKDKGSYAALALGGMTQGTTTVKIAQSYASFANMTGTTKDAHAVVKIVAPQENNRVLQPAKPIKKHQVFDPKTAWYMTRMLLNNVEEGTGTNAQVPGHQVAGKTGTTQSSKEAWFVGYTSKYVSAVTVFNQYDKNKENDVELSGGGYAAPIFQDVMSKALEGLPPQTFQKPSGVPDPQPPFELKPITDLRGGFDGSSQVNLQWSDPSDRLKYRVERSEDGSNWSAIGETSDGAFTDSNIEVPGGGLLGGGSKTYHYRVIAIDTQAEDSDNKESGPSNVMTIRITAEREEPPEDDDEEEDEQPQDQGQDQNPNGGDTPFPPGQQQQGDRTPNGGDRRGDNGNGNDRDNGNNNGWPWGG